MEYFRGVEDSDKNLEKKEPMLAGAGRQTALLYFALKVYEWMQICPGWMQICTVSTLNIALLITLFVVPLGWATVSKRILFWEQPSEHAVNVDAQLISYVSTLWSSSVPYRIGRMSLLMQLEMCKSPWWLCVISCTRAILVPWPSNVAAVIKGSFCWSKTVHSFMSTLFGFLNTLCYLFFWCSSGNFCRKYIWK